MQELATNARLNHWPPHLGVKTDADKIEFLASKLEETRDTEAQMGSLVGELEDVRDSNNRLIDEVNDLKEEIVGLKDERLALKAEILELKAKVADVQSK